MRLSGAVGAGTYSGRLNVVRFMLLEGWPPGPGSNVQCVGIAYAGGRENSRCDAGALAHLLDVADQLRADRLELPLGVERGALVGAGRLDVQRVAHERGCHRDAEPGTDRSEVQGRDFDGRGWLAQ